MPDINELLEQCEQRSQVLSQESDRAANEVNQIVQFVTTLAANLRTASDEAQANFEAISSKLEAAEQNFYRLIFKKFAGMLPKISTKSVCNFQASAINIL